jgi:hypothetical protein
MGRFFEAAAVKCLLKKLNIAFPARSVKETLPAHAVARGVRSADLMVHSYREN